MAEGTAGLASTRPSIQETVSEGREISTENVRRSSLDAGLAQLPESNALKAGPTRGANVVPLQIRKRAPPQGLNSQWVKGASSESIDQAVSRTKMYNKRMSWNPETSTGQWLEDVPEEQSYRNPSWRHNGKSVLQRVASEVSIKSAAAERRRPVSVHDLTSFPRQLVKLDQGSHYAIGDCIGKGHFGTVYRALELQTGNIVAVKQIKLSERSPKELKTVMHEIHVLKSLNHKSIVKYIGCTSTTNDFNIVMELVESGNLAAFVRSFGPLPEALAARYSARILEALEYLHSYKVIHRDLKAANILLTRDGQIKLTDFGTSLIPNIAASINTDQKVEGSPNWMAPEIIQLETPTVKCDIWSLGCTVIEIMTGKAPYQGMNGLSVLFKIVEDNHPPFPTSSSVLLRSFLRKCFKKSAAHRPGASIMVLHPWIAGFWRSEADALSKIPSPRKSDNGPRPSWECDGARDEAIAANRLSRLEKVLAPNPGTTEYLYQRQPEDVSGPPNHAPQLKTPKKKNRHECVLM